MSLIQNFRLMAEGKSAKIGIGLGKSKIHNEKIVNASLDFLDEFNSSIFIFGGGPLGIFGT